MNAGLLLVFISALGFFITPALLGGLENMTIAILIEQQTSRLLDWPMASALATLLLAATALLFLFYDRGSRQLGAAGAFGGDDGAALPWRIAALRRPAFSPGWC